MDHHVVVVGVGFVELEAGEFRAVRAVHAFVAEVLREFKDLFHAAHDAALEIKFRSDAQVKRHVASVVVRGKRTGVRAAVNRLERRSFDFDESLFDEVFADSLHDLGTLDEDFLHVVVQSHVDIALTIAGIHVGKFVEHNLVAVFVNLFLSDRKRAHSLRKHRHLFGTHRVFTALRFEHRTVHTDEVTEVGHLHNFVVCLAHFVTGDHNLQTTIAVLEVHKAHLALAIETHHAAGKCNRFLRSHQGVLVFLQNLGIMGPVKLVRISIHTHFLELVELSQASLHLVIHILHCHIVLPRE